MEAEGLGITTWAGHGEAVVGSSASHQLQPWPWRSPSLREQELLWVMEASQHPPALPHHKYMPWEDSCRDRKMELVLCMGAEEVLSWLSNKLRGLMLNPP